MRYYKNLKGINSLICIPNTPVNNLSSREKNAVLKSRKKYGYAAGETYALDYTAAIWLYEHLRMLQEVGGKFVDYNWEHGAFTEQEEKMFVELGISPKTDNDVFNQICKYIENAFEYDEDLSREDYVENLTKAFKLWSVTFTRAWW